MEHAEPLRLDTARLLYRAMIGTGGIGTGSFFMLRGNHTLGREESRSGHFIDRRDYCKLHIVSHYVQTLLGSGFATFPIGMVGDDDAGSRLKQEMAEAGLDLSYVRTLQGIPTLFSFCYIYPDDSGGNMTTDDSASSQVCAENVREAEAAFSHYGSGGVALAVPEVPLQARFALLDMASAYSLFRVASFTSGEIREMGASPVYENIDLLALNLDELRHLAGHDGESRAEELEPADAMKKVCERYPRLLITVTDGSRGSWSWDGNGLCHQPAVSAEVASTAGAGDAFLAGVISGLTAGLSLNEAQQLGTLTGALSVTSPHTIHRGVHRRSLSRFLRESGYGVSDSLVHLID